ncbi:MAG: BsuBI/PstI family type II restriction endonuclease [Caldilineaceae bacterium]
MSGLQPLNIRAKTAIIKSMITARENLLNIAESYRIEVNQQLDHQKQVELGQFMTPDAVAHFMASLFEETTESITLLDPGAGVGSLTSALVHRLLSSPNLPADITVDAYEIDALMIQYLVRMLRQCGYECQGAGIDFSSNIVEKDFVTGGADLLWASNSLFAQPMSQYSHCIMNPPYKKIRSDSIHRQKLSLVGIETSNLYSAFLAIAIKMLAPQGQLVAIVPRSFCNGVYFKPFRQLLLSEMAIKHLHIFESRKQAFKDNEVLQENIILYAVKHAPQGDIHITASSDPSLDDMIHRIVSFEQVVKPNDVDCFIHIATSDLDQMIVDRISVFTHSLHDLGLEVSTGPVVDFRLKSDIRQDPKEGAVPLIYPGHFSANQIQWPKLDGKKPNAILESDRTRQWLMPNGWYVLTRRFSSKEEKRRIVAAVCDPRIFPSNQIGFENHLNIFHNNKNGLDALIAKGLAIYLNSTLVDLYFRQFSGHTQVNATDLRMLRYPNLDALTRLGSYINGSFPKQGEIDGLLEVEIHNLTHAESLNGNPMSIQQKIQDALFILDSLGMPRGQRNERSALTLLALLGLKPDDAWADASSPLIGITPIMEFVREHYAREYAPNTRETFRRQTMHQFMDAGIAIPNPDQPDRPTNSPKWVYQIEPNILELLQSFGKPNWEENLEVYFAKRRSLIEQYARRREMEMIPLVIGEQRDLYLTPGEHSKLIRDIIEEFGPRFAPGAEVLYIGDTGSKLGYFVESTFHELGLFFDNHGKFPDVVVYDRANNWLLLIEAVTSHGPVDAKRHLELATLFKDAAAGLVYVTAFPDRATMARYLSEISWETEVWVAATPTHLIHFDGERYLGPYD